MFGFATQNVVRLMYFVMMYSKLTNMLMHLECFDPFRKNRMLWSVNEQVPPLIFV
uniref:Uncharacterized protein n=1 Tax=Arundo donax TaxID=35708 RepID=A0A0A9AQG3_ARUDO